MSSIRSRWEALPLSDDMTELDPATIPLAESAKAISFDSPACRLISPDDGTPLLRKGDAFISAGGARFPIKEERPILLPQRAIEFIRGNGLEVPAEKFEDAFLQYLHLSAIKGSSGQSNLAIEDIWYRRHLHRSRQLLSGATGLVLDIGCDDPRRSRQLFPANANYVGIDPALGKRNEPSIVALAECLPFADETFDGAAFLTSLDHVLDYQTAIEEAFRVLRPGGTLFLATLIWTASATLLSDNVHFHHFRAYEIEGVLQPFEIDAISVYRWKGDKHRFGVYIRAVKPGNSR